MPLERKGTVSIGEYLNWYNKTYNLELGRVEDYKDGIAFCIFFNDVYPDIIQLKRLRRTPIDKIEEHECIENLKILQDGFTRKGIARSVPIAQMAKGQTKTIFDFLTWFHDRFLKLLKAAWAKEASMYIAKAAAKPCLEPAKKAMMAMKPIYESSKKALTSVEKLAEETKTAAKPPIIAARKATAAIEEIIPVVEAVKPPADVLKEKVVASSKEKDINKAVLRAKAAKAKAPPVVEAASQLPPASKNAVESSKDAGNANVKAFKSIQKPMQVAGEDVKDMATKAPKGVKPAANVVPLAAKFKEAGTAVLKSGEALDLMEKGRIPQGNSLLLEAEKILEEEFKVQRNPEGRWLFKK